ncbi:hypothetical protein [Streptomyces spinosirectus]
MSEVLPDPALHARLARWVAEGLLDAGQAERIEAAEQARTPYRPDRATRTGTVSKAGRGGRIGLVVEALGYLGGAMALVAGFLAVNRLWPDIPAGAEAAFAAVAALVLGVAGALLGAAEEPALVRLRSVLWLLSTVGLAAFVAVLAGRVGELSPQVTALLAAGTATVYAVVVWLRGPQLQPQPLSHLAVFAGSAVTLASGAMCLGDDVSSWVPGLAVWLLSAVWGVAAHYDRVPPRTTGYLASALGLLIGAQMTMDVPLGHILALFTVGALLAAGVALRRVWLLALGAYGAVQAVPQTAERYLPGSLSGPLSVLTVGVLLLALALLLARWTSRTGPPRGGGPRTPSP